MDKNGLERSIYCGGEKILERECIKVGVSENWGKRWDQKFENQNLLGPSVNWHLDPHFIFTYELALGFCNNAINSFFFL